MTEDVDKSCEFLAVITGAPGGFFQLTCSIDIRGPDGSLVESTQIMQSPPLIETEIKAKVTARELARSFGKQGENIRFEVRP